MRREELRGVERSEVTPRAAVPLGASCYPVPTAPGQPNGNASRGTTELSIFETEAGRRRRQSAVLWSLRVRRRSVGARSGDRGGRAVRVQSWLAEGQRCSWSQVKCPRLREEVWRLGVC